MAQDAGFAVLLRTSGPHRRHSASIGTTDERLVRRGDPVKRLMRATVKGQRFYLAKPQEAISLIMEFTPQKRPGADDAGI
jgi:hypothetical protein